MVERVCPVKTLLEALEEILALLMEAVWPGGLEESLPVTIFVQAAYG